MYGSRNYIPPMLIYPRKQMSPQMRKNGPVAAFSCCFKNLYFSEELLFGWLLYLFAKASKDEPVC